MTASRYVAYDAATVRQPAAHAITHLGCRILNRDWPAWRSPPPGTLIAIHAGQLVDERALLELRDRGLEPERMTYRSIVAVARIAAVLELDQARAQVAPDQQPWITGPLVIVLGEVAVLDPPVGAAGALGCWLMSDHTRLAVSGQVRERFAEVAHG